MELNCAITREVVKLLQANNIDCYIVGGYVRDHLLGVESNDIDIELHGTDYQRAYEIITSITDAKLFGNFGVISLTDANTEFAIARIETKTGNSHTEFAVDFITDGNLKLAASRRDFTINSIMYDLQNDVLIDNFNGINDLNNKIIKHVSDAFSEDPLRVLRAFKFAARLGFEIADETYNLCLEIASHLEHLSTIRIENELNAIFSYGNYKQVNDRLTAVISKYTDSEYELSEINNPDLFKVLFFAQFLNSKLVINKCIESKKDKKELNTLIDNYQDIKNYSQLNSERKVELLNSLKLCKLKAIALNPYLIDVFELFDRLKIKYDGNYLKSLGYTGKNIAIMQKKIIGEELDELRNFNKE